MATNETKLSQKIETTPTNPAETPTDTIMDKTHINPAKMANKIVRPIR